MHALWDYPAAACVFFCTRAGRRAPGWLPTSCGPGRGLRTETEIIGFAGRRTRTGSAARPPFLDYMARGLRTETEIIGFAGRHTQTGSREK